MRVGKSICGRVDTGLGVRERGEQKEGIMMGRHQGAAEAAANTVRERAPSLPPPPSPPPFFLAVLDLPTHTHIPMMGRAVSTQPLVSASCSMRSARRGSAPASPSLSSLSDSISAVALPAPATPAAACANDPTVLSASLLSRALRERTELIPLSRLLVREGARTIAEDSEASSAPSRARKNQRIIDCNKSKDILCDE
jgi:hypothetical protein